MSYIGGKARGAAHILAVLNDPRYDGLDYLEPFVGMAHVLRRVERKRGERGALRSDRTHRVNETAQRRIPTRHRRPQLVAPR